MTDKCPFCGAKRKFQLDVGIDDYDCGSTYYSDKVSQTPGWSRYEGCYNRQISQLTTHLAQAREELADVKEDHRKVYQQSYQEWLATREELAESQKEIDALQGLWGDLARREEELADAKERLELWREFDREMELIADNGVHTTFLIPTKIYEKAKGEI